MEYEHQQQGSPQKPSAPPPPIQYVQQDPQQQYQQQQQPPMAVMASPQAVYLNMPSSPPPQQQVVVIQQAAPASPRPHVGWKSGLCGCTDNCCNCWMVVCCPCVTYGQIAARVGGNGCCDCGCCCSGVLYVLASTVGFNWLITCLMRQKVAAATGVQQNCCDDTIMSCCCGPCVTCQMATHLDIQKDSCSFAAPPLLETMQR